MGLVCFYIKVDGDFLDKMLLERILHKSGYAFVDVSKQDTFVLHGNTLEEVEQEFKTNLGGRIFTDGEGE